MKHIKRRKTYALNLLLFILLLTTCSRLSSPFFINHNNCPREIIIYEDYFNLEWDNPAELQQTNSILLHKIYIRKHGDIDWQLVKEIDSGVKTSCIIRGDEFEPNKYDIGVSFVTTDGTESAIHSSLDKTASPPTGWYIFWIME